MQDISIITQILGTTVSLLEKILTRYEVLSTNATVARELGVTWKYANNSWFVCKSDIPVGKIPLKQVLGAP